MNTLLDRVGNLNPQVLRELRGKLKMRSLAVAIAIPLVFQILLLLFQFQRTPSGLCQTAFRCAPDWSTWWLEQFRLLFWLIPYSLFFVGTFSLIIDLTQENSKGTLNFIRLSPRSSLTIFLGKLLGAPILTYIGVGLLFPLHLITGLAGGVPLGFFISYYLLLLAFAFLILSLAIAFSLIGFGEQKQLGIQAYGGAAFFGFASLSFFTPVFIFWNSSTTWVSWYRFISNSNNDADFNVQWWYLPLGSNVFLAHLFTLLTIGILSYLVWQVLRRRFYNPKATILSKGLSYFTSAFLEVFILGFLIRSDLISANRESYNILTAFLYVANFFLLATVVFVLTPTRQSVAEWAKYGSNANIFSDLIWYDKTPSILAIAINLVITQSLTIGWVALSSNPNKLGSILIFALLVMQWLVYALIYQNILISHLGKPLNWAVGTIVILNLLPSIIFFILAIRNSTLWLAFGSFWSIFYLFDPSTLVSNFITAILILGIFAGFGLFQLFAKIKKLSRT